MELIEIEKLCRAELWGPFPYPDLRKLRDALPRNERKRTEGLNPSLDIFLMDIVGFATTATTVMGRPTEYLRHWLPVLDKCFYEHYPDYEFLQDRITESETPDLFSQLEASDVLRKELAKHIRDHLPE